MLFNQIHSNRRLLIDCLKRCAQLSKRSVSKNVPLTTKSLEQCKKSGHEQALTSSSGNFLFYNEWSTGVQNEFMCDMTLVENFITETEEKSLIDELEQVFKRMRYEYDHWDDAIHGYRETQRMNWYPDNRVIIDRVAKHAFSNSALAHVHILDLAKNGIIKPHVDSSRYCGNIIAGISLLTDCIMRLKRIDETKYYQGRQVQQQIDQQIDQQSDKQNDKQIIEYDYYADILLKRRSMYVMKDSARYNFTHEVLATGSVFNDAPIEKDRRISIVCRNDT